MGLQPKKWSFGQQTKENSFGPENLSPLQTSKSQIKHLISEFVILIPNSRSCFAHVLIPAIIAFASKRSNLRLFWIHQNQTHAESRSNMDLSRKLTSIKEVISDINSPDQNRSRRDNFSANNRYASFLAHFLFLKFILLLLWLSSAILPSSKFSSFALRVRDWYEENGGDRVKLNSGMWAEKWERERFLKCELLIILQRIVQSFWCIYCYIENVVTESGKNGAGLL